MIRIAALMAAAVMAAWAGPISAAWAGPISAAWAGPISADVTTTVSAGMTIRHDTHDEGTYFATPPDEVAYNVQILRLPDRFVTVYHGEPNKQPFGFPGDSVKTGIAPCPFLYRMPPRPVYSLWGVQDPANTLFSGLSHDNAGCSGTGKPTTVRGRSGDDHFYTLFLFEQADNGDRLGASVRQYVGEARTRDFSHWQLRATVHGRVAWADWSDRPFPAPAGYPAGAEPSAAAIQDVTGRTLRSEIATRLDKAQGYLGSLCRVRGLYYYFYTDVAADGRMYLYARTCRDLSALTPQWSAQTRVTPEPLMPGALVRVAKARRQARWAVLYNGYRMGPGGPRQDLMLQYTRNLRVTGPGGISDLTFYDSFPVPGLGVSRFALGLAIGRGCGQEDFLTDADGNLTVPDDQDTDPAGGFITWMDAGVALAGAPVYWATWTASPTVPAVAGP